MIDLGFPDGAERPPLIVDDDEPCGTFVERVLQQAGYETATAADGPEAFDAAANGQFDILVTDSDDAADDRRRARASPPAWTRRPQGAVPDRLQRSAVQGESDAVGRTRRSSTSRAASRACSRRCRCCCSGLEASSVRSRHLDRRACASRGAGPSSADPDRHERAPSPSASRSSAPRSSRALPAAAMISAAARQRDAPRAQRRAQVDAARRVQAQVPHAVGRQAAAVAAAAERLGGRRDDAEGRAVRQREAIGRRRRLLRRSARSAP